jgi:hypothetical protein
VLAIYQLSEMVSWQLPGLRNQANLVRLHAIGGFDDSEPAD